MEQGVYIMQEMSDIMRERDRLIFANIRIIIYLFHRVFLKMQGKGWLNGKR